MKKILGLDLGSNSIGWALIEKDDKNSTGIIIKAGSRIIPMDQGTLGDFEKGNPVSQTADRTKYRGVRRLKERAQLRRERLHRVLNVLGYLPEHYAGQIDFDKRLGKFKPETEPKIAYKFNAEVNTWEFIFKDAFNEMVAEFKEKNPELFINQKIPYDWTLYYLRKKALTQKVTEQELAWIILNFNQKRGYFQLRGEDENKVNDRKIEYYNLLVTDVIKADEKKATGDSWFNVILENGWIYRRTSKTDQLLEWKGKIKEFIVTEELDEKGNIKKDKEGKEKRSFRAPDENDWTLIKTKTENQIQNSNKFVSEYIFDALIVNPNQKIRGKLVRTIERKYYRQELEQIMKTQIEKHNDLRDRLKLTNCILELYKNNKSRSELLLTKDFSYLFINDIIFYQRPLKSKKSLISNCKFEYRFFKKEGKLEIAPIKCVPKSHPLYQEFRLWQFIHNLRIYEREQHIDNKVLHDIDITSTVLKTDDDRIILFDFLNDKEAVKQKSLLEYFFKKTAKLYRWNYVDDDEKEYPCNATRGQILSKLKNIKTASSDFLTRDIELQLWHILYSVEDKEDIKKALVTFAGKHNLPHEFVDVFIKIKPFEKEYGAYSEKALKKLLSLMRIGKYWNLNAISGKVKEHIERIDERLKAIDYNIKRIEEMADDDIQKPVLKSFINCSNKLSGYNTYQASYAVYEKHSEESDIKYWKTAIDIENFLKFDFKQHSLKNPIVEQVITETLRLVKSIWNKYGEGKESFFDEIHIELSREMKNTAEDRKQITKNVNENENTNIRIKTILAELANFNDVENVRPFSPSQQEILKIYEDGVLKSQKNLPDDIAKISKSKSPTKSDVLKYKLWLDQKYRSPYTGEIIPLSKLFTPAYQIEHIIPQSRYFDDSFSNKVICEAEVNKEKDRMLAYEFIKNNQNRIIECSFGKKVKVFDLISFSNFVKENYTQNRSKFKKLLLEDIPEKMIERQLNDTRYISKIIRNLLSNIVRVQGEEQTVSKNVIATNGTITGILKQDWGLNDVWNDIIAPRFERMNQLKNTNDFGEWINKEGNRYFQIQIPVEISAGFNKKRIDHRHHTLDAIVIACATNDHVNYLNNKFANEQNKSTRFDLQHKLCDKHKTDNNGNYKWLFKKPWHSFTQDTKNILLTTLVSFKQNLRIINKTVNTYQKWGKDLKTGDLKKINVKQTVGENLAIRKPLHKETVFAQVTLRKIKEVQISVALNNWQMIVDKQLKQQIKILVNQNMDKAKITKFFKELEYKWNGNDITRVKLYYYDTDNAATRIKIDETFTEKFINESITDTGIQKILLNHLHSDKYQNQSDDNNKPIAPETLAFSPEGIDEMNRNIVELNNGKYHMPLYKVRKYETIGNKFVVGQKGNKKTKFVEAAKGTNLYFAIYANETGKRYFETIPLNVVIERLKQKLKPVPETYIDSKTNTQYKLLFWLSPNDLVYVPSSEEFESKQILELENLSRLKLKNLYNVNDFNDITIYFTPNSFAKAIASKELHTSYDFKQAKDIENKSIKDFCWKLEVDNLGEIIRIIK